MELDNRSRELRRRIVDMVSIEKRGHIGSALSLIEILRVLYDSFLKYDPRNPLWEDRDRCILSKGHGCLAWYAILADKGFVTDEDTLTVCQAKSKFGGHPERGKVPGVEASTGALGHGLPIGVGMAIGTKIKKKKYRVVVITGDGEINEGSVWEAAMSAGKHQLDNLTVFVDYNKIQSYGSTKEVLDLEPLAAKWASFGFAVDEVDGHSVDALEKCISRLPFENKKPSVIICHTVKGKGLPFAEHNPKWHHKRLNDEELQAMYEAVAILK